FLIIAGGQVFSLLVNRIHDRRPTKGTLHLRVMTHAAITTAALYVTGWGPVLTIGYAIAAQENVANGGSAAWRITLMWDMVGIAVCQLGIGLHLVPSFIPSPAVHGLAILGTTGLVAVLRMTGSIAAEKERATEALRDSEERFRSLVHNSSDLVIVLDASGRP